MKKIVLFKIHESVKTKDTNNLGQTVHDVSTADVVGVLNLAEDVVTLVKSHNRPIGYKMSLKEFGIQSVTGEI